MIPTMILVGLVLGFIPRYWEHRLAATVLIGLISGLAWGFLVDGLVEGTLLALANIAVGVLVGAGLQALGHLALRRPAH